MVYGFAKQSGGHLKIYSEVGHGTTVRLYLPRAKTEKREENVAARPAEDAKAPTEIILVVEDNAAVRATVLLLLSTLKYEVLEAENARQALEILGRGDKVDLLFTDIVMPGDMSGTDLATKAREMRPDLAVLFTSGFTEASMRGGPSLAADDQILSKPYRREELATKIREVLGARKGGSAG
jgi:CheY-like chemotaxis protein